ncbi:MAG: hypothetical protein IJS51_10585 [Treponema sp.]|nr:hypothetical protein [Treponema sp.]MBQ7620558.1 hypothetical protein [Treponema sp.]
MISNITNLNPYSYHVSSSGASGKLFVPVSPSAVIYAQFNHISGVAAPKGQSGVSISKIQILNSLIENLSKIKGAQNSKTKSVKLTEGQVDVLIEKYQKEIARSVQASQAQFMLNGAKPEAGALFSIQA